VNTSDWTVMIESNLESLPTNNNPYIYFLMNDWELIYIGETTKLKGRISVHDSDKNTELSPDHLSFYKIVGFNKIFYRDAPIDRKERYHLEQKYIEDFKPKYNDFNLWHEKVAVPYLKKQKEKYPPWKTTLDGWKEFVYGWEP